MNIFLSKLIFSKLGLAFLITSTVVATPIAYNYLGAGEYLTLKTAVKNTIKADSLTVKANLIFSDDKMGKVSANSTIKTDIAKELVSSSATAVTSAGKFDISAESKGQSLVIRSTVPGLNANVSYKDQFQLFKSIRNDISFAQEFAFDFIIADIKRKIVESSSSSGNKEFVLKVKGDDFKTMVTGVIEKINPDYKIDFDQIIYSSLVKQQVSMILGSDASKFDIPILEDGIIINEIDLRASTSANKLLKTLDIEINTSGNDKAGKKHNQIITLNTEFLDINKTIVQEAK